MTSCTLELPHPLSELIPEVNPNFIEKPVLPEFSLMVVRLPLSKA
jgi:hypothetical protein